MIESYMKTKSSVKFEGESHDSIYTLLNATFLVTPLSDGISMKNDRKFLIIRRIYKINFFRPWLDFTQMSKAFPCLYVSIFEGTVRRDGFG
jgi:hypothetical protein